MRNLHQLAPLWIAALSLGISGFVALTSPLPVPQFHDEFSYLLAADTFAHGRLTNPIHPLWEFFESFQLIQNPSYMSKYPPGQGLMLGLGKLVFGHAIFGVWLSTALACAALWWGLRELVPPRWAIIGAVIAATHPLMLKWNWSYWGGSVAVIGGALVVGGIARMGRAKHALAGLMLGIGLLVLAITRPYEGLVLVMLSFCLIRAPSPRLSPGGRGGRRGPSRGGRGRWALSALMLVVMLGAGWIGYYNWRVTGSAVRLPYAVYESTYAICPPVIWWPRAQQTPQYRNDVMRDYYLNWELAAYERQRTVMGLTGALGEKLWSFARAYFYSVALLVPFGMSILVLNRDWIAKRAMLVAAGFTLIVLGNLWFFPHYTAPAVLVYLLIIVQGLRHLRALDGGRRIVGGIVLLHLLAAIVWWYNLDRTGENWKDKRANLIEQVRREGRRMLVIVRPGPGYYPHNEWVYNDADIDASPVVWARDRGEENQKLLEYFADREPLILTVSADSMKFERPQP